MFSAITTKPLLWVNPKPLRDGALPVAKNDSIAREIPALLRREATISFSSNNAPGVSNFLIKDSGGYPVFVMLYQIEEFSTFS
uniref:Uncharacterized protein n=1 Tax=Glossina palpalis gambiensis TaxID=67801 RepID=A0A1B0BC96_9MUSC